jgi:hypothetical protein
MEIACRPLNVFQPYQFYDLSADKVRQGRVTITAGPAVEPVDDFVCIIKDKAPVGAWVYQSPPVRAQHRPYFVNVASSTEDRPTDQRLDASSAG